MIIYKVYTDEFYDGSEWSVKYFVNKDTAMNERDRRMQKGDESYVEEVEVITE